MVIKRSIYIVLIIVTISISIWLGMGEENQQWMYMLIIPTIIVALFFALLMNTFKEDK